MLSITGLNLLPYFMVFLSFVDRQLSELKFWVIMQGQKHCLLTFHISLCRLFRYTNVLLCSLLCMF